VPRTKPRVAALLLPLVLLIIGCSAGPSDRPAVAYRTGQPHAVSTPPPTQPVAVPPLGPAASEDKLPWADCTGPTLAKLRVPAEPAVPPGMTFSCARMVSNLDAPDAVPHSPARIALLSVGSGRIPLVVLDDAGGEPGTTLAARLALRMPPEMLNTFQIIGMDRRGTGESDAAQCIPSPARQAIVGFDPRATAAPALAPLLDSVRSGTQECLLDLADRLPAYDTWRAAGDLEQLRLLVGVPKLHAIGRGEAARVLTTYSQRYPNSVGRMVLDGAPDPTLDATGESETQAQGAEQTFEAFATDCVKTGCPLGADPRRAVSDLVEHTRTAALPAPDGPLTAGKVVRAVLLGLADHREWPDLAAALDAANRGDGTRLAALAAPLIDGDPANPPRLDADIITSCNDSMVRMPPQRATEIAGNWVGKYPLFGGVFAQQLIQCSLWPMPQQPLPTPTATGLSPIPVISTTNDPLTPAQGSEHMADQLSSGVLLNWQGTGHGAIGRSDCVTRDISRFLIQGTVPANRTACPA
jgi:pimeloyl-ACP methyl ester carboxylesterase